MIRLGVDIGGTFTDLSGVDEVTGAVFHLKTLTTPDEPSKGVIEALDKAGFPLHQLSFLGHGTTVAINAIIQGKGARTAVIATAGFRDTLELRRGARTHLLDPLMEKPAPFVPRRWRVEVPERILFDGTVHQAVDEGALREALAALRDEGIESVAVCLLHSYANQDHERQVLDIVHEELPGVSVTLSSDVVPEIKEYERTSTAALNAYIQPVVAKHLRSLESELQDRGLNIGVQMMQSNGGVMTVNEAAERPICILESGPAAGSIGATYIGTLIGVDNLITFDMGGTTAKTSVIEAGQPLMTVEYELFEEPNKPGSGWPIRMPMIDVVEAGAGGGSIARLDEGGSLQVGPESAGADPGPVCYGKGGTEPTITDANAILGRMVTLLDGELALDLETARRIMAERIADPLGISVEDAAAGILEIADAMTADVIREVTISRGRDPRDFTLLAMGGAGPMEAAYVISELGLEQAVVPPVPGNFSAFGLITADAIHDSVRTFISPTDTADLTRLNALYTEMEDALVATFDRDGIAAEDRRLERTVDVRYRGQFHIINVPIPTGTAAAVDLRQLEETFHDEHLRLYTYKNDDAPTELVNVRVRGTGIVRRPALKRLAEGEAAAAVVDVRSVYFREVRESRQCTIYKRDLLGAGSAFEGPAIVEEQTSTTLVPPGFHARVDDYANIIISTSRAVT